MIFIDKQNADRMPIPLGTFISEEVYNNKLRSEHRIDDMGCVAFVDVSKGREEKCGNSWRVSSHPALCGDLANTLLAAEQGRDSLYCQSRATLLSAHGLLYHHAL